MKKTVTIFNAALLMGCFIFSSSHAVALDNKEAVLESIDNKNCSDFTSGEDPFPTRNKFTERRQPWLHIFSDQGDLVTQLQCSNGQKWSGTLDLVDLEEERNGGQYVKKVGCDKHLAVITYVPKMDAPESQYFDLKSCIFIGNGAYESDSPEKKLKVLITDPDYFSSGNLTVLDCSTDHCIKIFEGGGAYIDFAPAYSEPKWLSPTSFTITRHREDPPGGGNITPIKDTDLCTFVVQEGKSLFTCKPQK